MKLKRILVPYDGEAASEEMLRLACLVAKSARGHVIALSVIPSTGQGQPTSTEAAMPTQAVLERAERVGALYGVEVSGIALQAADATATVLDKAKELASGAIFMGLPRGWCAEKSAEAMQKISEMIGQASCPILFGCLPEMQEAGPAD